MLSRTLVSRVLLHRTLKNAADNMKLAKRNSGHGSSVRSVLERVSKAALAEPPDQTRARKSPNSILKMFAEKHDSKMLRHFVRLLVFQSTWSYRVPPPLPSKRSVMLAEALGGFAWFWILWHLATEPEHVYGEWPYIEPCTWTNEELGIPSDDDGN